MAELTEQARVDALLESRQRFVDYVRARVDDPGLAEDIVHDSMVRALRAAPDLRDDERLLPWFFRVLRNAVIDEYRKRATIRRHFDQAAEIPDLAGPPADDVQAICACFRALLPMLKAEYAEVLLALDLSEEPSDAVAQRLGVTPGNLKVRRHRARQALREQLEAACGLCAQGHCLDCTC